ncbi:MAG: DUF1573 domain-containing protein [Flavobacterium sp.]
MKNIFLAIILVFISCKEDASSKIDPNSIPVNIKEYNDDIPKTAEQKVEESVIENQALPNTPTPVSPDATTVSFNKKEHDFGTINEGKTVTTNFKITNTGKKDLIIQNATASCGCTVPDYPKHPIKPGSSGNIKVSFDSTGKPGQQQKTVTVTANIPNGSELLTIKTNVTPKKQASAIVEPIKTETQQ